jgi:hypothetical protein
MIFLICYDYDFYLRFEVLTAVKMSVVVFWVLLTRGLVMVTDVSEERFASIFTVKTT